MAMPLCPAAETACAVLSCLTGLAVAVAIGDNHDELRSRNHFLTLGVSHGSLSTSIVEGGNRRLYETPAEGCLNNTLL